MPAFTLQKIIDRAAAQADMRDGFVAATEWVDWYNVESRALELFMARNGWIQNLVTSVSDSSSPYTITLPDYTLAVMGVYEVRDGRYRPLRFRSQADIRRGSDTGPAMEYSVTMDDGSDDLTVNLYPAPTTGTYTALCFAGREPVPNDDDIDLEGTDVQWPLGFEERIVLGMALKALTKEESDTRPVEKLLEREDQRIEEFCWSRQIAEAPTVRNTDRVNRGWGWDERMLYGSYESWYWF